MTALATVLEVQEDIVVVGCQQKKQVVTTAHQKTLVEQGLFLKRYLEKSIIGHFILRKSYQ